MFRNYLASALGNLRRNWLYASVTIGGLAVSFAAAILIGLYLRDELGFDRFIPGYQQVYRVQVTLHLPGAKPFRGDSTYDDVAKNLRLDFPQIEQTARMEIAEEGLSRGQGQTQTLDRFAWVDTAFFEVMPFPVLAGDPDAALEAPDGLVLTREMARKYFGEDAPIGKSLTVVSTLELGALGSDESRLFASPHPMRVLAVLKDPPASSHLTVGIFGSGRAPLSLIAFSDRHPTHAGSYFQTYVRLKPGAAADPVRSGLAAFASRHYGSPNDPSSMSFELKPLSGLHFTAVEGGPGLRAPGDRTVDAGIGAAGLLIIAIAAINFVTLMTARATRRTIEVGIRKAVGARRRDLVAQFMGEALIHVLIAMVVGVAVVELVLPYANAFLQRSIRFDYLSDPELLGAILALALLTGLLAGAYPALVLSGFRPAAALKGGVGQASGSAAVRQTLVVAQFAILIGLMVTTVTVYRQTSFALNDAMRLDVDQVLRTSAPCEAALKQQIKALPGVKGVSCASASVVAMNASKSFARLPDRGQVGIDLGAVDVGFFELQGLKPLAGRLFSSDHGEDVRLDQPNAGPQDQPSVVLNEAAVRQLGFRSPEEAVGKTVDWVRWFPPMPPADGLASLFHPSQVVGVVPDFTLKSIRQPIAPTIYYVRPGGQFMLIKLSGRQIPETLAAVDRVWKATGHELPLSSIFESHQVQDLYRDVITQGVAIAICAGLAILIACLGLFALAAFTTERRTKEIGVRKAMGAGSFDIVRLLVWQFTKPVLWANLIAWPVAFWAMDNWLHGFAYRVDLPAWLFLAASALAVLIAWATVSLHAWLVARARPVTALRYE